MGCFDKFSPGGAESFGLHAGQHTGQTRISAHTGELFYNYKS